MDMMTRCLNIAGPLAGPYCCSWLPAQQRAAVRCHFALYKRSSQESHIKFSLVHLTPWDPVPFAVTACCTGFYGVCSCSHAWPKS